MRRLVLSAVLLSVLVPQRALAGGLWVYNVHSHEVLRLFSLSPSEMDSSDWRQANRLWRSRRARKRRTVHPRLLRILAHIQSHFGGGRLELISGYRAPVEGDKLSSYHQVGRAADIRIRGITKRVLFEFCRTLPQVGCGYYPHAEFVHVDTRGQSAIWVDLSPPGQPRRYVKGAAQWLRAHR